MTERERKDIVMRYPEHISYPFDELYKKIGYEGICFLSDTYGGGALYIQSEKRMFTGCYVQEMLKEFDGANYDYLVRKYGFSERSIRYKVDNNRGFKKYK